MSVDPYFDRVHGPPPSPDRGGQNEPIRWGVHRAGGLTAAGT